MNLIRLLEERLSLKFLFFCFVGGSSALIDLIIFNIAFLSGVLFVLSRLIATVIAIIYNFSMNRNITFNARHDSIKKQIPRYAIIYSLSIIVNISISVLVLGVLGESILNANIASIIGILISIPISFFGSLLWVFRKKIFKS